jgi:hypothetical protein
VCAQQHLVQIFLPRDVVRYCLLSVVFVRSAALMMAVGSPIHVPHIQPGQEGFNEAVDAAHEQLVRALVALYDKYKVRAKHICRAATRGGVCVWVWCYQHISGMFVWGPLFLQA